MKTKIYFLMAFSFLFFKYTFSQSVLKGTKTNFNTNVKTNFNFSRSFITKETEYVSIYKLTDIVDGKPFGLLTITNNKPALKIRIELIIDSDTSRFEINYTDSLGSVFGLKGTFKKEPANKFALSVAFIAMNKTYLKVNQIIRKNTAKPEHYLLDKILADDLLLNSTFLSKIKNSKPTGASNKALSMSDFGIPNANAINSVDQNATTTVSLKSKTTITQTKTTEVPIAITPTVVTPPIITVQAPVIIVPVKIKSINSTIQDLLVDSIRTILKSVANEMVSVQLYISGGTSNYTVAKEGIEALAINWALHGGTKNLTADQVQKKIEQLGIEINYNLTPDYSTISLNCLRKQFDESWSIFTDLIARTGFQTDAFESARAEALNNSLSQNTFNLLQQIALSYSFIGKQYDKNPIGSAASISKLTLDEVKKYYSTIMARKRLTLVVCGKLSIDDLNQKIRTGFKGLPNGTSSSTNFGGVDFNGSAFKFISTTDNSVNEVVGLSAAPDAGSIDEAALTIALGILSDRINIEIEQKRNLTNDFNLNVIGYRQNFCLLSLTAADPEKAIQGIIDEIKKAKKLGFTADELQIAKDQYITNYYLQNESNEAITQSIGRSEMNNGWRNAENLYATINNVLLNDVNSALRKYIKGFRFYYSGDKDVANEIIFTQKLE